MNWNSQQQSPPMEIHSRMNVEECHVQISVLRKSTLALATKERKVWSERLLDGI